MIRPLVAIRDGVAANLASWCKEAGLRRVLIVEDETTYGVLGRAVEEFLRGAGLQPRSVVLAGPEVLADAHSILQVLLSLERRDQALVAVGSGTITDITRFVSHRTGLPFVAMPTAPSVDGFASSGSPLIVRGIKTTASAQPPAAIFADLAVLQAAPRSMVASGFGDMLGKRTSVADWKLGSLLWDTPFDGEIAKRCIAAVGAIEEAAAEISRSSREGVRRLLEALIESGFCMLDFGSSLPASGAEHHYSHFWEMRLLTEGKPAILHGAKVGVATILTAALYRRVGQLTRNEAARLLKEYRPPSADEERERVRMAFGPAAFEVAKTQATFLEMTHEGWERLKQKIVDQWSVVQDIAREVPAPERIARLLREAGGPTNMRELGLPDSWANEAADVSHYLRNHFTVSKLARFLSLRF